MNGSTGIVCNEWSQIQRLVLSDQIWVNRVTVRLTSRFSNWTESLTVITSAHCSTNNPTHSISLSNVISETGQSFLRCSRWFDSKHGPYTERTGGVSRRPSSDTASGVWDVLPLLPGDKIHSSRESHGCNQGSTDERQRKWRRGGQVLDKCAPKLTLWRLSAVRTRSSSRRMPLNQFIMF